VRRLRRFAFQRIAGHHPDLDPGVMGKAKDREDVAVLLPVLGNQQPLDGASCLERLQHGVDAEYFVFMHNK
jgi:hypothetical protein